MVSSIANPFYPEFALAVERAVRRNGQFLIVCNTNEDPLQGVRISTRSPARSRRHSRDQCEPASAGSARRGGTRRAGRAVSGSGRRRRPMDCRASRSISARRADRDAALARTGPRAHRRDRRRVGERRAGGALRRLRRRDARSEPMRRSSRPADSIEGGVRAAGGCSMRTRG